MGKKAVIEAATALFDNRMGHRPGNPQVSAPRELWADLGASLYGEDDPRVKELREVAAFHGFSGGFHTKIMEEIAQREQAEQQGATPLREELRPIEGAKPELANHPHVFEPEKPGSLWCKCGASRSATTLHAVTVSDVVKEAPKLAPEDKLLHALFGEKPKKAPGK